MTGIAVLKVDDLGRRPLLIGGVGGIVSFKTPNMFSICLILTMSVHLNFLFLHGPQAVSLLLLWAYYKFLGGFPFIAVGALLLYVGSYQVIM